MYTSLVDEVSQRTNPKVFKVGIAFSVGSCLGYLSVIAMSGLRTKLQDAVVPESTSLFGLPASRMKTSPLLPMSPHDLPGAGPFKELSLLALESVNSPGRDVSVYANRYKTAMARMSSEDKAMVTRAEGAVTATATELKAGQTAPMGFFDPIGFATEIDEGTLTFYREAELKHGRVGMLATLGMFVGEKFHPFFGGKYDVPSVEILTKPDLPMQVFWVLLFVCIGVPEFTNLLLADGPYGLKPNKERILGDLGFDPLNIKPQDPAKLLEVQNKELNNGRLAMLGAAGILAQELVTGKKIF